MKSYGIGEDSYKALVENPFSIGGSNPPTTPMDVSDEDILEMMLNRMESKVSDLTNQLNSELGLKLEDLFVETVGPNIRLSAFIQDSDSSKLGIFSEFVDDAEVVVMFTPNPNQQKWFGKIAFKMVDGFDTPIKIVADNIHVIYNVSENSFEIERLSDEE